MSTHNWKNLEIYLDGDTRLQRQKEHIAAAFFKAISTGEEEAIRKEMRQGAYIGIIHENMTALMHAVTVYQPNAVRFLLNMGGSSVLQAGDSDAVWVSYQQGKLDLLTMFLSDKPRLNREVGTEKTLLIHAVESSNLQATEIIAPRVNINEYDKQGNTALHYNMRKESPTPQDIEIGRLLISLGADANTQNADGETPTMIVASGEGQNLLTEQKLIEVIIEENPDMAAIPDAPKPSRPKI